MSTAPEWYFPTDHEVDQWLEDRCVSKADMESGDPAVDQSKAAADDLSNRFRGTAIEMVASGKAKLAVIDQDHEHRDARGVARSIMAAESAGIRLLCPHAGQTRPKLLTCDPPTITCLACIKRDPDGYTAAINKMGHLWNHLCDRCGAYSRLMTEIVSTFGHLSVIGHLCDQCADEEQREAVRAADAVVLVPRQHPKRTPRPGARGRRNRS